MVALLYSLFAALSGLIEAVLYSRRGAESFDRNEHAEMVLQRLVVLLLPLAGVWLYHLTGSWVCFLAEHVAALLLFPMVHDEVYNFARLWIRERVTLEQSHYVVKGLSKHLFGSIDGAAWHKARLEYEYGYQSPTTTARNDFDGKTRTLLAIAGVLVWLAGLLYFLLYS